MNQSVLNISPPPSEGEVHSLRRKRRGSTKFQDLVLGPTQEGSVLEGNRVDPFSGGEEDPTNCIQESAKGQSFWGGDLSKVFPQGGRVRGGKAFLSLLKGTQPKGADLPSIPEKQNSEGGGKPAIGPDGPLSPGVKPRSLRLSSLWPKGNRGKAVAAFPPISHLPSTSNISPSPSLNFKAALLGAGLPATIATPTPPGYQCLKVPSQGDPQGLTSSPRVQQGIPPADLKARLGETAWAINDGSASSRGLRAGKSGTPHSQGASPLSPIKVEVVERPPSQLTLILRSSRADGPLRLEVNLSQVDSFLNRVMMKSLEKAVGWGGKGCELTIRSENGLSDKPQLNFTFKEGKIIGEVTLSDQRVKGIINQALPQLKRALSQVGIEVDSLQVSLPTPQRRRSPQASSKHSSAPSQAEEAKAFRLNFPSSPVRLPAALSHHQQSPISSPQVKGLNPLIDQLIGKLKVNLQQGRSEATVALKPDYLGNLQIKLTLEGKNIVGKILVDNPLTKSLIQSSLPQLRDSLTHLGIQVQNFDVAVGGKFPSPQRRSTSRGKREKLPPYSKPLPSLHSLSPVLGVNMAAGGGVDYLA